MGNEKVIIDGYSIEYYNLNTLIIGSGAASLNAAVTLHSMGQEDILIATSQWGGGTSNNAGSDKQTYYKLSLSGDQPDSVREMARDLFNGRCMHGDIALCEAQGSVQAFMNLVRLGVPFPHDRYGAWAGYKTDHDPRSRATSAGPYTSRMMFEALAGEVKKSRIRILDKHHIIALLTDSDRTRVTGALAINTGKTIPSEAFVLFNSVNTVMGTGGPGGIYETSVYPLSQSGSSGIAFDAGASGQNLTESQFGIASLKFRWNLSGSYQQVIPRYYSTREDGSDEKEFLNDVYPDYTSLTRAIFLKGYQWPFDSRKLEGFGSSLIDLLVFREREERGRRVWIDYRRNPSWGSDDKFLNGSLDPAVTDYLARSGALRERPAERLSAMNSPAVTLYKEHGIDLFSEPLEIAVCAQHNNGGLKGNIWWESDLRHLFPVGEVNGSHGVYRPGGSALNSGQAGSYRAAQYIVKKYNQSAPPKEEFLAEARSRISHKLGMADCWLSSGKSNRTSLLMETIRKRMSASGGILRRRQQILEALREAADLNAGILSETGASSVSELVSCYTAAEHCLTHLIYLEAINAYIERGGRSRGSYIITEGTDHDNPVSDPAGSVPELCRYDIPAEKDIMVVSFTDGKVTTRLEEVREIPPQDLWFEKVWKEYREDNYF